MQHDVLCAPADGDVYEVIALMKQHRVKRVLVCDQARHVIGMLTRSDLMRIFFDRYRYTQG
jgi:CBS domain-containing membrane protein